MDRHLTVVSVGTRVIAIVVGFASLASLVSVIADAIVFARARNLPPSANLDISKYGIAGLLQNGANSLQGPFTFLAGLSVWVMVVLAIFLVFFIACAAIMYASGVGLSHHATWARVLAILGALAALVLFLPLLLWAVFNGRAAVAGVATPLVVAAAYSLWVLFWRFGAQAA